MQFYRQLLKWQLLKTCILQRELELSKPSLIGWCRKMSSLAGRKVYVTRLVPNSGIDTLKAAGCVVTQWESNDAVPQAELKKSVPGIDALFCLLTDRIDEEILEAAGSNLKIVSTMSVGYEHLDLKACRQRSIKVGYTPGILTDATAELGVALLLCVSRRLAEGQKAVTSGEWSTWAPMWMCGKGLANSTVGIIGLGRIGMAVARRLKPFCVADILYTGPRDKSYAGEIDAKRRPLDEVLATSDFIVATCPLTPETKELFCRSSFAKMKKSAIFINISRSGVVNQDDLYEALKTGVIGAAGLDVTSPEPLPPNHPLLDLKNCIILPHIGSATIETRSAMSKMAADNIIAALRGEPMPNELLA